MGNALNDNITEAGLKVWNICGENSANKNILLTPYQQSHLYNCKDNDYYNSKLTDTDGETDGTKDRITGFFLTQGPTFSSVFFLSVPAKLIEISLSVNEEINLSTHRTRSE